MLCWLLAAGTLEDCQAPAARARRESKPAVSTFLVQDLLRHLYNRHNPSRFSSNKWLLPRWPRATLPSRQTPRSRPRVSSSSLLCSPRAPAVGHRCKTPTVSPSTSQRPQRPQRPRNITSKSGHLRGPWDRCPAQARPWMCREQPAKVVVHTCHHAAVSSPSLHYHSHHTHHLTTITADPASTSSRTC